MSVQVSTKFNDHLNKNLQY